MQLVQEHSQSYLNTSFLDSESPQMSLLKLHLFRAHLVRGWLTDIGCLWYPGQICESDKGFVDSHVMQAV